MTKKYKYYIEIPFLNEYFRNKKTTCLYIPLLVYIYFSWDKYEFSILGIFKEYFPKGNKEGTHKLTINIGFLYWNIKLIIYEPKS